MLCDRDAHAALVIGCRGILDDEARGEVSDLVGEFGFFDAGEDFFEILVGIGGFVDGIFSAVEEDVVLIEFLVDSLLIK